MIDLERITALADGDSLCAIEIPPAMLVPGGLFPGTRGWISRGGLRILAADEPYLDGRFGNLRHVSFSRPSSLPTWRDVRLVKDTFYGDVAEAMLVLPKAADYTNVHPYCHHLWQMPEPWTDAGAITHATIEHRREAVREAPGRPPDEPARSSQGDPGDAALEAEPVHPLGAPGWPVHAAPDGGGVAGPLSFAKGMTPLIET